MSSIRLWITITDMQMQIDVESIRSRLKAMTRAEVIRLARSAGLAPSTVEKFRLSHIKEPRHSKLQKLAAALGSAS